MARQPRTIPPQQLARARDLRHNGTRHEAMLWSRLRASACGHKFSRQISIGPWIADFVCRRHRVIVELDGGHHDGVRDARRDADLRERGYRVVRIPNWAVDEDVDGVVRQIVAVIEGSRWYSHPQPLPLAGGETIGARSLCSPPASGRG